MSQITESSSRLPQSMVSAKGAPILRCSMCRWPTPRTDRQSMSAPLPLRNIAIIAHVDHGKTTLVDQLFRQSGTFRENQRIEERAMDSNDLEKERGITILAKCTSV